METYAEYIEHYGVKGMRWGIRRTPEQLGHRIRNKIKKNRESAKARQEQMKRIAKRSVSDTNYKTLQYATYGSRNLARRYGSQLAGVVVARAIQEVLTDGDLNKYKNISKSELAKQATRLMGRAAVNTAIADYKVRNISKRYDEKGKSISKKKKKNNAFFTPEDKLDMGLTALKCAVYAGNFMTLTKLSQMKSENDKNKQIFERWGKNILESSYDDVVYQSPGGEYYVYNSKKR